MQKVRLAGTLAAVVVLVMSIGGVSVSAAEGPVQWTSYENGMAQAKATNKKVFLNFHADWCRYCLKMEKETFTEKRVAEYLNANFIPIMVDTEKEKKLASDYNVRALPTNWFLEPDGTKISTLPGYVSAEQLLPILKYLSTDSYQKMSFKDFLDQQ